MTDLSRQRCANHRDREAAARCPACHRYFCRECVTEHEGRMLCAACIADLAPAKAPARGRLARLSQGVWLVFGLVLLWTIFYYLGRLLMLLPASFHDGTLWQSGWWSNL
ncbi:MAG: hypothetical protein ACLFPD_03680 [Desulfosudaceae bacterium]